MTPVIALRSDMARVGAVLFHTEHTGHTEPVPFEEHRLRVPRVLRVIPNCT